MGIKEIKIKNFKSFEKVKLNFSDFNVVVGKNASGKSNLIQLFKFLSDIKKDGLCNAISMQGGVKYLRNINIGSEKELEIGIVFDPKAMFPSFIQPEDKGKKILLIKIKEVIYKFVIKFLKRGENFRVIEENMVINNDFLMTGYQSKKRTLKINEEKKVGSGSLTIKRIKEDIDFGYHKDLGDLKIDEDEVVPFFLKNQKIDQNKLIIESPFLIPFYGVEDFFDQISVYDFDPKLPKKAVPITGKTELEEDGSNLAIVLKNIINNKDRKRKFSNIIRDLLPFIDRFGVQNLADKSLLAKMKETYFEDQYIPASFVSDGTLNIIALITILYFERKPVAIIEEPERNIHPFLIAKTVEMLKEASKKKQIIITTHNPEIVKYAGVENLLLISRNKKGFSTISKPEDSIEVEVFLQNELGIEELFVKNLLGE